MVRSVRSGPGSGALLGQQPGDVTPQLAELRGVLDLLRNPLVAEREESGPQPAQLLGDLLGLHLPDLSAVHAEPPQASTRRPIMRQRTGIFIAMRKNASRARVSLTPASSNS